MSSFAPYLIALAAGLPPSLFGYLKYRVYIGLARKLIQQDGATGLKAMEHVAPPARLLDKLPLPSAKLADDQDETQLHGWVSQVPRPNL